MRLLRWLLMVAEAAVAAKGAVSEWQHLPSGHNHGNIHSNKKNKVRRWFGSYFNRLRIEPKIPQAKLLTGKEKGPLWERL